MKDSGFSAWLYKQLYCRMIGSVLPAHWFGPRPPEMSGSGEGRLHLEVVSHCWQYAHLSIYQVSSLVNYPPQLLDLTYTLYYSEEDTATVTLVKKFSDIQVPNIQWNFQPMQTNELYRRAIGRNRSALTTAANWIWFADCDLIFHQNCLDSLAQALPSVTARMAYPASEQITELLPAEHALVNLPTDSPQLVDIDASMFYSNKIEKAKGAFQIVHGDVARHCGYCKNLKYYQQPTKRWRKTFEDTAFRRLISDEGVPVPVEGLHRIRHQVKGRYVKDSRMGKFRQGVRQLAERDSVKTNP